MARGFKQNEPRVFKSPVALKRKLAGFDDWIERNGYPYKTFTRLSQFLGVNRETLHRYIHSWHKTENMTDEEFHEYELCRLYIAHKLQDIEAGYEDRLNMRESNKGSEFSLKNNFGWLDRQEVKQDTSVTVKMKGEELADFSK